MPSESACVQISRAVAKEHWPTFCSSSCVNRTWNENGHRTDETSHGYGHTHAYVAHYTHWIDATASQCEMETWRRRGKKKNRNKNLFGRKYLNTNPFILPEWFSLFIFSKYDTKHCNICDMPLPPSTLITSRKELTDRCHSRDAQDAQDVPNFTICSVRVGNFDKNLFKMFLHLLSHPITHRLFVVVVIATKENENK